MIVRHLRIRWASCWLCSKSPRPRCKKRARTSQGGRTPPLAAYLLERRLKALPQTLPEQIGCLGRHLVALLKPWASTGRAVALDSTVLWAKGGVCGTRKTGKPEWSLTLQ